MNKIAVCFVCLGNICRSPSAEAVFRDRGEAAKLADRIVVDSAGTSDWHIGHAPDERAQRAAKKRGYDLSRLRGRQVDEADFECFDLLLAAMDDANVAALAALCPPEHRDKIRLLMEFATSDDTRVVDPYFGGDEGFEKVLDQCEDAYDGLLKVLRAQLVA